MKELSQQRVDIRHELHFIERVRHEPQPAFACGSADGKGHVTHAKTRVAPRLDITLGTTEPPDQKVTKALLGATMA